jgi:hypothetical protein
MTMPQRTRMVLAGLAIAAGISLAQTDKPISGVVVNKKTQEPVPNAKIQYGFDYKEKLEYGATSDDRGVFTLSMISYQKMTYFIIKISVEAEGYSPKEDRIFPDPSGRPNIRIELEPAEPIIQELIPLRNPYRMDEVLLALRAEFGGKLMVQINGKGSIQITDTQEKTMRAKALISFHDVPLRQIWIQILLIQADGTGGQSVPDDPEFKAVHNKLKSLFKFRSYRVIGQVEINGQEGSPFSVRQDSGKPGKASFAVNAGSLEYSESSIRINRLSISVQKPIRTEISTTVNVPIGDTIVLGASKGDLQDVALISVVKVNAVK